MPKPTARTLAGDLPEGRPEHDFYPTPAPMTKALLEVEKFDGQIWEPACGDGAMSRVLGEYGYEVVESDIEPRGVGMCFDFLTPVPPESKLFWSGNIVTNPPFKLLNKFILTALAYDPRKLALLTKIQALATQERSHILEDTHLARVHVFRARYTMWRNGIVSTNNGGTMEYCWLVWERGYTGKPTIDWI